MRYSREQLLQQALGLSQKHLVEISVGGRTVSLHGDITKSYLSLSAVLAKQGFEVSVASSYRSFERQLAIFSAKACGKRAVLDSAGLPLDVNVLNDEQLLFAILRWSALPGLSRHHFGSDIDVFDAAKQRREDVELVPSEVEGEGPSAALHEALDELMSQNESYGFFRPYQVYVGGIAPERWHLSAQSVSSLYDDVLTEPASLDYLLGIWRQHSLPLYDVVQANIELIFERYVQLAKDNQASWLSA